MKHIVTVLALALSLAACAPGEPKQAEQPTKTQEAASIKETSIDDAPNVNPHDLMTKDPAKPAREASQAQAHFVSMNIKSRKYHEFGCRYYGCNSCEDVSLTDAQAAGGVPCKKCH